jgi:hypothetical protein
LGTRIPDEPYAVAQWRREHPGQPIADGQVFTQPWPAAGAQKAAGRRDKVIYYQYRHDRGRRTLRGIDEQVAKAEKAVAGLVPVKRNRFITLAADQTLVNRELEAKARGLAGLKGYTTNLAACPGTPVTAEFVIGAYHQLFQIEEVVPDGQKRPAGPAGLPSPAGLDRGPPDGGIRRPGRQPLDRSADRMVNQEVRPHHPPLQDDRDPGRKPHHHRRAGRPQRRDGHRPGIVGIVLIRVTSCQQPDPCAELGRHVQHPLTGRQQLPGQQMTQAAGALDRPAPLRPGLRPGQHPLRLGSSGRGPAAHPAAPPPR